QGNDQDASEVKEEDDVDDRDEDYGLPERVLERVHRAADESAPIIEWNDRDAGGQTWREQRDLHLDVLNHLPGGFAGAHYDRAADDFMSVDVERAPTVIAAELDGRKVLDSDRDIVAGRDGDRFDVSGAFDESAAANNKFGAVLLQRAAADIQVVPVDGFED